MIISLSRLKDYIKLREKGEDFSKWKEVFVDPGVYKLTTKIQDKLGLKGEYSWEKELDIMDFLDTLPVNHYFSADYPCDMNLHYTARFLDKSWINANKYCNHPQYLVTVQNQFNHYFWFKEWCDKYNQLPIASGIMGLGNICRILHLTEYIKHSLGYAFRNCKHKKIHIYGLCLKAIPYAYNLAKKFNIELSIDSTKWTRCTQSIANKITNGIRRSCKSSERQAFFNEYLELIKRRGVNLE